MDLVAVVPMVISALNAIKATEFIGILRGMLKKLQKLNSTHPLLSGADTRICQTNHYQCANFGNFLKKVNTKNNRRGLHKSGASK
jgi:hypothetical protein